MLKRLFLKARLVAMIGLLCLIAIFVYLMRRTQVVMAGTRINFDPNTVQIMIAELDPAPSRRLLLIPVIATFDEDENAVSTSLSSMKAGTPITDVIPAPFCCVYDRATRECRGVVESDQYRGRNPVSVSLLAYPNNESQDPMQPRMHDELRTWVEYKDREGRSHRLHTRGYAQCFFYVIADHAQPIIKKAVRLLVLSRSEGHYKMPVGGSASELGGSQIFEFFELDCARSCPPFSLPAGYVDLHLYSSGSAWGSSDARVWVFKTTQGFFLVDIDALEKPRR